MATSKTPRTKPLKPTEVKDPTTEPEGTDVPVPTADVPRDDARTSEPETTTTGGGDPAPKAPTEDELTKAFNEPPEWVTGSLDDDEDPKIKLRDIVMNMAMQAEPSGVDAVLYRQDDETLEVSLLPIPEWQPTETGEEYSDRLRARNHFLGRLRVAIDREQFYLDDTLKSTAREIAAQAARGRQV